MLVTCDDAVDSRSMPTNGRERDVSILEYVSYISAAANGHRNCSITLSVLEVCGCPRRPACH
jgi:hypothetical protein